MKNRVGEGETQEKQKIGEEDKRTKEEKEEKVR